MRAHILPELGLPALTFARAVGRSSARTEHLEAVRTELLEQVFTSPKASESPPAQQAETCTCRCPGGLNRPEDENGGGEGGCGG